MLVFYCCYVTNYTILSGPWITVYLPSKPLETVPVSGQLLILTASDFRNGDLGGTLPQRPCSLLLDSPVLGHVSTNFHCLENIQIPSITDNYVYSYSSIYWYPYIDRATYGISLYVYVYTYMYTWYTSLSLSR